MRSAKTKIIRSLHSWMCGKVLIEKYEDEHVPELAE